MGEQKQEFIIRQKDKTANFSIIYNDCFKDVSISLQAKGLFAYIMTLPADWELHKTELVNHSSNGRDSTIKAFDELIEKGYITVEEIKGERGQFGKKLYKVFETSQGEIKIQRKKRNVSNRSCNTVTGNPLTVNQELLNTDILKTKTNNKFSSDKPKSLPPRFKSETTKEEDKQDLSSLSIKEDALLERCVDLFISIRRPLTKSHDPVVNKLSWKNGFFQASKKLNICLNELYDYLTIVERISWLRKAITCPSKFVEYFDRIYAEKVDGNNIQAKQKGSAASKVYGKQKWDIGF